MQGIGVQRTCKVRARRAAQNGWRVWALGVQSKWDSWRGTGKVVVGLQARETERRLGSPPDHILPVVSQCPALCLH